MAVCKSKTGDAKVAMSKLDTKMHKVCLGLKNIGVQLNYP